MSRNSETLWSRIEAARQLQNTGELESYASNNAIDEVRTNSWGPANRK